MSTPVVLQYGERPRPPADENWVTRAACRAWDGWSADCIVSTRWVHPGHVDDPWYPEALPEHRMSGRDDHYVALEQLGRRICHGCPVKTECLEDSAALPHTRREGMRAGLTAPERRPMYRRQSVSEEQG